MKLIEVAFRDEVSRAWIISGPGPYRQSFDGPAYRSFRASPTASLGKMQTTS